MDIPSAACVEQRTQGSNKLQRKGFSAALTRTQTKKNHGAALRENTEVKATEIRNTADGTDPHPRFRYLQRRTESNAGRGPSRKEVWWFGYQEPCWGEEIQQPIQVVIGWVWQVSQKWLDRKGQNTRQVNWEAKHLDSRAKEALTVKEHDDALKRSLHSSPGWCSFSWYYTTD